MTTSAPSSPSPPTADDTLARWRADEDVVLVRQQRDTGLASPAMLRVGRDSCDFTPKMA